MGSYLIVIGGPLLDSIYNEHLTWDHLVEMLFGGIIMAYFISFLLIIPSLIYTFVIAFLVNPYVKGYRYCLLIGSF